MQQILFFFIRNKNFLLFGLLFIISLSLTIRSHSFHKSKFVSSSNFITGGIYTLKSDVTDYFGLREENQKLVDENMLLRKLLESYNSNAANPLPDSTTLPSKYKFFSAKVINNNFSKTKNNITIDRGAKDSIAIDMGVITSKGIVGIINAVSQNYATIQSILNTKSQINAKLKHSEHFGTLKWDTKTPNIVQLTDVPRLAVVKEGDTVVTGGRSTIFPKGILIGTVNEVILGKNDNYYNLNILLFNDMTNIHHVYIIENQAAEEILQLEKEVDDAEQ
ncbi:rod shape-determining protein MreC [Ulvibacter sp. MAR_2010_11]|uniref:rod shape-determining protein MreC n=1 Tax=Ulvibacter sp. MAR_2010_11 TaxID=1250229 RepID=UPI000C2C26E4|nr:rod shape-determining protein MreC [Ulvibacter sp. MAR_2010_11]PKA82499.1 rod shape-determining protein MreC [Ulvibacter sp. MAR_2010_11]